MESCENCGNKGMACKACTVKELDGKRVTSPSMWKPKTYTLEEIAAKICESYEECTEGECPGFDYCRHKKKGTLTWL